MTNERVELFVAGSVVALMSFTAGLLAGLGRGVLRASTMRTAMSLLPMSAVARGGTAAALRESCCCCTAKPVDSAAGAQTANKHAHGSDDSDLYPTDDVVVPGLNELERELPASTMKLHDDAVAAGEEIYKDPDTGFTVFTRLNHLTRGYCCGSYCRHCPYGFVRVPGREPSTATAQPPAVSSATIATTSSTPAATAAAQTVPTRGTATTATQETPATTAQKAAAETAKVDTTVKPADATAPKAEETASTAKPTGAAPKHSIVYTKGGDKGSSALFSGERRKKNDPVFETEGVLDELSSHVGLARALLRLPVTGDDGPTKEQRNAEMAALLKDIQQQLLNAGSVVAIPAHGKFKIGPGLMKILESYDFAAQTAELERHIDEIDARLTPLRVFILPGGGNAASAQLHVCRTVCRRAERSMIDLRDAYGEQYTDHLRQATVYINRLSDFFFVAARSVAEEDVVRKYD